LPEAKKSGKEEKGIAALTSHIFRNAAAAATAATARSSTPLKLEQSGP
jgi:hypothetical protein